MPLIAHLLGHPAVCLKHLLQLQCSPTPNVGSTLRFVGLRWRVKLAMFDPGGRVPKGLASHEGHVSCGHVHLSADA